MSRTLLPFHAPDISALARSLNGQLAGRDHPPGHVEMLNMLARAAGFRNFQHFRAVPAGEAEIPAPPSPPSVDLERVRRVLRVFDGEGRLVRWPPKQSQQELCLWVLWSRLPARAVLSEPEINQLLQANHLFGDYALLRRWLVDLGLVSRTPSGSEYRRVERRPSAEAAALFGLLRGGRAA